MKDVLNIIIATSKRQIQNSTGYKLLLFYLIYSCIVEIIIYFYTNKFVDQGELTQYTHGVDYFTFILIGYIFSDIFYSSTSSSLGAISGQRIQGTFESFLISPYSLFSLLYIDSVFGIFQCFLRIFMFVLVGYFFGFRLEFTPSLFYGFLFLALSVGLFLSFSVIFAGFTLLDRRFSALVGLYSIVSTLFSGAFFPVQYLPGFLREVIYYMPFPYAMINLREILAGRGNPSELIMTMAGMTIVAVLISGFCFQKLSYLARRKGYVLNY